MRYSIQNAIKEGLQAEADIERLVTQICYRAADLAYLLDLERKSLADYSAYLRETTEFDRLPPLEGLLPSDPPEE